MALDPYSPCPCGSGKKFKWCCQPIHVQIDKAFTLHAEGQHEAALRTMNQVVADYPTNPEAWGRKAQLLYESGQVDEAEEALQKALEVSPTYPFGYFLRGLFRQEEGETAGALSLFRKAAELYDPEAKDILGQLYAMIAECELKLNRPVAGRAALRIAMRCDPASEDLRRSFDSIFGEASNLPDSARREYTFLPPAGGAARGAWDQALAGAGSGKLADAARAFEQVTAASPDDAAAWYNLGLARAWLGDNRAAIEALDRYVALEPDEAKAAAAWTLGEILRCGHGMEGDADYVEHAVAYRVVDPRAVVGLLQTWESGRRLVGVQTAQDQGILTALVLEASPNLTPALAATQLPRVGAYLLLVADRLRIWNTSREAVARLRAEILEKAGSAVAEARESEAPAHFNEVLTEALAFPVHATDKEEANRRVRDHVERFFEETWIHRPLHALDMVPPIDAAGHGALRKKLRGVVQFLEECARPPETFAYDFERLRRKLGLAEGAPPAAAPAAGPDIGAMSVAELAALPPDTLADDRLEQAYQAALKLDARDVAGRFARTLVGRPPMPGRPDRYPWFAHLVQQALAEGNMQAALDLVNEGEKQDCEHNEGRRRNDYELRRGQIHAKRGEADEAEGVFQRLIERLPTELRYRGSAAEAMLSARQGARALRFAEQGLAKAREKNDRDSEEYFKELVAAAQRQAKG